MYTHCNWPLTSYTGPKALNPSGRLRRVLLRITPPCPACLPSVRTPARRLLPRPRRSPKNANSRGESQEPTKDGSRQHPVDGKTDVFPEQLADIIAEQ